MNIPFGGTGGCINGPACGGSPCICCAFGPAAGRSGGNCSTGDVSTSDRADRNMEHARLVAGWVGRGWDLVRPAISWSLDGTAATVASTRIPFTHINGAARMHDRALAHAPAPQMSWPPDPSLSSRASASALRAWVAGSGRAPRSPSLVSSPYPPSQARHVLDDVSTAMLAGRISDSELAFLV